MTRRSIFISAALVGICFSASAPVVAQRSAFASDPIPDRVNPAAMQPFQLPSHGALLNAFVYIAAGAKLHPTVILLHGFPGNERNLDLAQSIRRAGWNVLYFDYRGSWGSPSAFSFTHCIEDTQAAIAYLRDPDNARKLRSDPNTIVLIGHSMGGFIALQAGGLDPAIRAFITISAIDLGVSRLQSIASDKYDIAVRPVAAGLDAQGMAPIAGTTPEILARELLVNATRWNFVTIAPRLSTRPMLVITSEDGFAPVNGDFVAAVRKNGGDHIATLHFLTDHSYSDQRIALQSACLDFLAHLDPNP